MRFRYAFQQIVDLKSNEKLQAEWVLSNSVGKLKAEEEELKRLENEKTALQHTLSQIASGKSTVSDVRMTQDYIEHLGLQIEHKHQHVLQAQNQVVDHKQALTDRMVDEKVWTTAKEKAFKHFISVFSKKEQQEIDEIASVRHDLSSGGR